MSPTAVGRAAAGPSGASATSRGVRARLASLRWLWAPLGVLAAVALWWPVGFAGTGSTLHLPLSIVDADALATGALAATATTLLLARMPWPRFLAVVLLPALCWVLTARTFVYPHEAQLVLLGLAMGVLVGVVLGWVGCSGVIGLATALAVIAALTPWGLVRGPLLALAVPAPER